ncbi:MAG: 16S rRNA (guanine(527)-N(7))-methyltransferase RsmG [Clostridia bacterium]|nr:16S rRNA (guanine(527)-N(7))-methyltransferase RsmG [Clostridia bacterium]MDQ7792227.1 16S rRNA (guanine(527)-N(7))-methyltransferase RsmG [Clostridia bacterium]
MPNLREILQQEAGPLGLDLDEAALSGFDKFYELLVEANRQFNLTSLVSVEDVAVKHFLDSLLGLPVIREKTGARLIDVGSGAGLPGLALKLVLPDLRLVLLESARKKCNFMEDTARTLGLNGVEVVWGRAEDLAREPWHRGAYDFVVARAVAEIRVLAEYCLPFLAVGGLFIAYKGPSAREEIEAAADALRLLGGTVEDIPEYQLPRGGRRRSLVCIRKTGRTPETYPRRPGTPKKKPL